VDSESEPAGQESEPAEKEKQNWTLALAIRVFISQEGEKIFDFHENSAFDIVVLGLFLMKIENFI
jgi:hypothetical protein